MDVAAYRQKEIEQQRVRSLMSLVPIDEVKTALDVGARDGYLSVRLAERAIRVVALDLETPRIEHPGITCVAGDATALDFPDRHFDLVLCAEVLEHLPGEKLKRACAEIKRVARRNVLIGVPYQQDRRLGRTTCRSCGRVNPPWGHVNSFDKERLRGLFPGMRVAGRDFVGEVRGATNPISTLLTDWGGNPFGMYDQDEPCIHCGAKLVAPNVVSPVQNASVRIGFWLRRLQEPFVRPHANWIHLLFARD